MIRKRHWAAAILLIPLIQAGSAQPEQAGPTARDIVQAAVDLWRGSSSIAEMSMTIHRPEWQRTMSLKAWTLGDDHSLVRVTAPPADAGNATLMLDDEMWSFAPRINRVVKIPSSLMGQSWMGSDFTNQDVARADEIIDQYEHELLETSESGSHTVYRIRATPHENAPVVWGYQVIDIRDDYVVLSEQYFDQEGELVKQLETFETGELGGRPAALRQRMYSVEEPDKWTEIVLHSAEYEVDLSPLLFTQANLRNPRE